MTVQSPSPPGVGDINHTSHRQWSGPSIYTVHSTAVTRHNSLGCCDDSIYDYDSIPSHYALILLVFMFINVLIVAINWLI